MQALLVVAALGLVIIGHELGHAAAAQALRLPWRPVVCRRGVGISIGWDERPLSRRQVAATAIAGPAASLLIVVAAWRIFPFASFASADVALCNLILPHSDGARLLRALRGLPYT